MNGDKSGFTFPAETINLRYPDVDVYLFEVGERKAFRGEHFHGLREWWIDWFKSMHIKNSNQDFVTRREDAFSLTAQEINKIFSKY